MSGGSQVLFWHRNVCGGEKNQTKIKKKSIPTNPVTCRGDGVGYSHQKLQQNWKEACGRSFVSGSVCHNHNHTFN